MTQNAYTDMVSGSHRSAYDSPGAMESHQTYDSNIFLIAVSTKPVVIFALAFQITVAISHRFFIPLSQSV